MSKIIVNVRYPADYDVFVDGKVRDDVRRELTLRLVNELFDRDLVHCTTHQHDDELYGTATVVSAELTI